MRSSLPSTLVVAFAVLGLACNGDPVSPAPSPASPSLLRSARAPSSNPRLSVAFDDVFANASIKSDGRGGYADAACGVFAVINLATGDALFDPDRDYKASMGSCGPRTISFSFAGAAGPVNDGSYVTMGGVYSVSGSAITRLGFMTPRAATGCDYIRFGYDNAAEGVLITRTSSTEWTVETQSGSVPVCWVSNKNRVTKTPLASMPLRLTLTQLQ